MCVDLHFIALSVKSWTNSVLFIYRQLHKLCFLYFFLMPRRLFQPLQPPYSEDHALASRHLFSIAFLTSLLSVLDRALLELKYEISLRNIESSLSILSNKFDCVNGRAPIVHKSKRDHEGSSSKSSHAVDCDSGRSTFQIRFLKEVMEVELLGI